MKKHLYSIFVTNLSVILLIIMACSNAACAKDSDLTRSKAKKILEKLPPGTITRNIDHRYGPPIRISEREIGDPRTFKQYEDLLDKLKANGYITYEKHTDSAQVFSQKLYGLWYDVQFTDKLKPFIINESQQGATVKVADIVIDEVTGITKMSDTERFAEYTTKVIPNALSKDLPLSEEENKSYKRGAHFKLYDDGWRWLY